MAARAGLLDRRIVIERRFVEPDTSGQPIEHWEEVARPWAQVVPLDGREAFGQEQFVATGNVQFTIRWIAGVTALDRIVHDGRDHDVVSVAEGGRRQWLMIVAKVRTDAVVES